MRSATREAVGAVRGVVSDLIHVSVDDVREVFAAARAIERSSQVLAALVDPNGSPEAKASLVERVLPTLGGSARTVVTGAARQRWSAAGDLLDGLEAAGVQMAARVAGDADVAGELHSFAGIVGSNAELELALGGALGDPDDKARVIERLLASRASESTRAILEHLVRSPRGRRIGASLRAAAEAVARANEASIATVTTAAPLPEGQIARLEAGLAKRYGRRLQVQQIVDPTIIGGLRVAVADDVIDGTIRTKFNDLRLQLGAV